MRVLVINAVPSAHNGLVSFLRARNVVVDQTDDGAEAVEFARTCGYDALLADGVPPDFSLELIRRLRAARIDTPVVLMAERTRPQAQIEAFVICADDLVTMPCNPAELLARIQAITRRHKAYSPSPLQCGPLQLDPSSREVWVAGRPVHLTGSEYAVLELLVLRIGITLTKETFFSHLYGDLDEPEMKIIDVFICKVRRKLADAGAPDIITTVWGRGYMMRDPGRHTSYSAAAPCPTFDLVLST